MTANEDKERFKLVIAGDGACGKTSLLTVFKVREILSFNLEIGVSEQKMAKNGNLPYGSSFGENSEIYMYV